MSEEDMQKMVSLTEDQIGQLRQQDETMRKEYLDVVPESLG